MIKRECDSGLDSEASTEDESFARRNLAAANGSRKNNSLVPRPNTSSGYWLCTLIPLCYASIYYRDEKPHTGPHYDWSAIAAIGMSIQSLCFFVYLSDDAALLIKLILSLVPSICTSSMYHAFLGISWPFALLSGIFVTCSYQNVYIKVMRGFPRSFSYGEASILVQGLMLFVFKALWVLPNVVVKNITLREDFDRLNTIMMYALLLLLVAVVIISKLRRFQTTLGFYKLMGFLLLTVTCLPITNPIPIVALSEFLAKETKRIFIIFFYMALVGCTILAVWWQLQNTLKASSRVRKIFHIVINLVFIPGLFYECEFLFIASGVALAIFTVLELMRIMNIPPLGEVLRRAFASFSDEKDAGLLALTPFCLLIGCFLPLWIHPIPCCSSTEARLAKLAGILAVGVGDTAASVVGSKLGRTKWGKSSRSLEGTVAFISSVLITVGVLNYLDYIPMSHVKWFVVIAATVNTALVEAFTDQIDNIVLPLVFYGIVNLV